MSMKLVTVSAIAFLAVTSVYSTALADDEIEVRSNYEEPMMDAQDEPDAEPAILEQVSKHAINEIAYTSGGVDIDDKARLEQEAPNYNLKVVMTLNTGHFLSDANVQIKDAKGELLLDTVSDGPLFYAKLEPGTYTVEATIRNQPLTKKVTIAKSKDGKKLSQHEIYFRWKGEEPTYWKDQKTDAKPAAKK